MNYPDADDLYEGKFTDGDPIAGVPPSVDSAAYINAIYDEIITVIEGATIVPDNKETNQLLAAINYYRNASNMIEGTVPLERLPDSVIKSADLVSSIHFFAAQTAPTGFIKANGAEVSRMDYADLFAKIGTLYGEGDGSTTFNVPDLRGEFIRGWDDGRGVDTDREFGSWQEDAIRDISGHFRVTGNVKRGTPSGVFSSRSWNSGHSLGGSHGSYSGTQFGFSASKVVPTAADNRPRNIALIAYIKY